MLILAPWVIGAILMVYQSCVYRYAAKRQRTTAGTITAHEPDNHSRYGYVFVVGGRTYHGWETSGEWALRQRVVVYYDASDPAENALRDFRDKSLGAIGPLPFLIVAGSVVGWFAWRYPMPKRKPLW